MSGQDLSSNPPANSSNEIRPSTDNLPQLSIERRTLLLGAAAVAAGALSSQASAAPEAPDLSGGTGQVPRHDSEPLRPRIRRERRRPVLSRQHLCRRASDPSHDRPAPYQTGRDPLGLLGDALRRLEADPFGRRDGLPRGAGEPRRQQSAQAHLFHRRHAPTSTLRSTRPRSSTFSTSFSIRSTPTSRSCATTSTIIGTSIGTCISA